VTAHSDKEQAAPTWKKGFGFHPLTVFADHGADGNGEPLAIMLRPGNAGSNTAAGHIAAVKLALAQLPTGLRRRVLVRADSGGGTHDFLQWLTKPGRRLQYSVGFTITDDIQEAIAKVPDRAWTPAYDSDGQVRDGAWVASLPACSTCHPGRRACGSSPARNARTPAPSCGSPTSTATGSPALPPQRRPGSWPTWNCGTAAAGGRSGHGATIAPSGGGRCRDATARSCRE
jgi:hypothetical protein